MLIFIRLLVYKLHVIIVVNRAFTRNIPNRWSKLDHTLQIAMEAERNRERSFAQEEGNLHNENKNQGLINTIVNHNKKIKNIENRFNLHMNNYANSSHIKEIVDKTKEIEKHIFGAPSPHRSWRDFLLVIIILGAIC